MEISPESSTGCQRMSAWYNDRLDYCREKLSSWIVVGHKIRNCVSISISSRQLQSHNSRDNNAIKISSVVSTCREADEFVDETNCTSQTKIMIILLLLMGYKKRQKEFGNSLVFRFWYKSQGNEWASRFGKCLIPGDIIRCVVTWRHESVNTEMRWRLLASSQDTPVIKCPVPAQSKSQFALATDFLPSHRRPLISGRLG